MRQLHFPPCDMAEALRRVAAGEFLRGRLVRDAFVRGLVRNMDGRPVLTDAGAAALETEAP